MVKCDMHLHSCYSKECLIDLDNPRGLWYEKFIKFLHKKVTKKSRYHADKWNVSFGCGFSPIELYKKAMENKMDFFCLTDHNTFDGCSFLLKNYPELKSKIITGVELTCKIPGKPFKIHVNIYNLNKKQFKELEKMNYDVKKVVGYCKKNNLICSLNHWVNGKLQEIVTDQKKSKITNFDLMGLLKMFKFIEVRNGLANKNQNEKAEKKALEMGKIMISGSDSHVGKVGRTWTEVKNAKTKKDFIRGIFNGKTIIGGDHANKKILKDEIVIQAKNYSGLYYTDGIKNIDKKVDFWSRGFLNGILYSSIEKFVKISLFIFSGIFIKKTLGRIC